MAWRMQACTQSLQTSLNHVVSPLKPVSGEHLYLYMSMSATSLSFVLFREDKDNRQSIFFIIKVFQGAEEKILLLYSLKRIS